MLLGPNGRRQDRPTLRMVSGLLKPDAGSIQIFGIGCLADPGRQAVTAGFRLPMIRQLTPLEYLNLSLGFG